MKSFVIGCLSTILGIFIGVAFGVFGSGVLSKPQSQTTPPSSAHSDLSITVSAALVSSQLQQTLRANGIVKNARITFAAPNLVRIASSEDASVLGFPISLNAIVTVRVTLQNSRVVLKTESVDTGGIPIAPTMLEGTIERVRSQFEEQLNRTVQSGLRGTNLRLTDIRMTENDVTVELNGQ